MILKGDLFDILPDYDADSFDVSVTDPPYGIGFMGKRWDTFKPDVTQALRARTVKNHKAAVNPNLKGRMQWAGGAAVEYDFTIRGLQRYQQWTTQWASEVFRVLKPGAYILVCGAPRSYHRMACGLEDAGFVVRDSLCWLFGQGFPKSKNLGDGKGTALKPGYEPIALAWKPFKGTIAQCHAQYGTAALNIDECRLDGIPPSVPQPLIGANPQGRTYGFKMGVGRSGEMSQADQGRWPPNVTLDEEAAALLDAQTGERRSGERRTSTVRATDKSRNTYGKFNDAGAQAYPHDMPASIGGASRFFYCAKASRRERDFGCGNLPLASGGELTHRREGSAGLNSPRAGAGRTSGGRNTHPTVKPLALMRWLVRLVTPEGGRVLDPFAGSGSTGMACVHEGRRFVGIEREAAYVEIARCRIRATKQAVVEFGQP